MPIDTKQVVAAYLSPQKVSTEPTTAPELVAKLKELRSLLKSGSEEMGLLDEIGQLLGLKLWKAAPTKEHFRK